MIFSMASRFSYTRHGLASKVRSNPIRPLNLTGLSKYITRSVLTPDSLQFLSYPRMSPYDRVSTFCGTSYLYIYNSSYLVHIWYLYKNMYIHRFLSNQHPKFEVSVHVYFKTDQYLYEAATCMINFHDLFLLLNNQDFFPSPHDMLHIASI